MFERFDVSAREAVVQAQLEARTLHHLYLGTEHLLAGVARSEGGTGARLLVRLGLTPELIRDDIVRIIGEGAEGFDERDRDALRSIGIDLEQVRRAVEDSFGPGALDQPARRGRLPRSRSRGRCEGPYVTGHLPFTPRAKKTLELALREAVHLRSASIRTEHILLGICREGDGVAAQILADHGINNGAIRQALADDPDGGAAAL
jgi:ATP-dependent Clp protease ATP-binding subunit ClpA